MQCWNCRGEVPDDAKACVHCEADLTDAPPDLSSETMAQIGRLVDQMPEEVRSYLQQKAEESETAEEFANSIMVGPCPACGSERTDDCENDQDYGENPMLGRCMDCGQVFCTECHHLLQAQETDCPWMDDHLAEYDALFGELDADDEEDENEVEEDEEDPGEDEEEGGDGETGRQEEDR